MSSLILHHYAASPYSEKIRSILGYKGLAWKSVEIPAVMPKPDLIALTGGYRRTPVLQIGRDVYCDTALIARVLDRLQPTPALVPSRYRASCLAFTKIEKTLFFSTIPTLFQPAGLKAMLATYGPEFLDRFSKDRASLFSGGTAQRPSAEFGKTHFLPLVHALDQQLEGAPFLLGDVATLADFCAYHPIWFVLNNSGIAPQLDAFKNLHAWVAKMRAFGHGQPSEFAAKDAIEVALTASTIQGFDGPYLEPEGVRLGQRVKIQATDYGVDPVFGVLMHASVFEVAIKRIDERAGELVVHFPRTGFMMTPASADPESN